MRTVMATMFMFSLCTSVALADRPDEETPHNRSSDCDDTINSVALWDENLLPLPAELTPTWKYALTDQRKRFHVAVASSTTPAGSSHTAGGLYVLTSRTRDRWDRIATVFTNTDVAVVTSAVMASNNRRCSFTYLHLYLVFLADITRNDGTQFTQLMYARSVDGGNTFSQSFRLDIHGGTPVSPTVSVTDNDKVRVEWTDAKTGKVFSRTSEDGDPNFTRQDSAKEETEQN